MKEDPVLPTLRKLRAGPGTGPNRRPPPVGGRGQHGPHGLAQSTGQMHYGSIDAYNEIVAGKAIAVHPFTGHEVPTTHVERQLRPLRDFLR